jgi:alkylphosphonate utilization operon protein PhnA
MFADLREGVDSNEIVLADGDSVTLVKDLKVKGTSETLKRGTLVKNIRRAGASRRIEEFFNSPDIVADRS